MTESGPDELSALEMLQARNALRATLDSLLAESGLKIRDLARDIVISNPHHPEKGKVYVGCPDGPVAWKRTVWDRWGYLTDPASEPAKPRPGPDAEEIAAKIISALTRNTQGRTE